MTGSYNEILSTMFSKNVRNTIQETKADRYKAVYSDVFPDTRIKRGDGAMNLWSLEDGYNNYLATSPTGTATGFGCTLMIIDDLRKKVPDLSFTGGVRPRAVSVLFMTMPYRYVQFRLFNTKVTNWFHARFGK